MVAKKRTRSSVAGNPAQFPSQSVQEEGSHLGKDMQQLPLQQQEVQSHDRHSSPAGESVSSVSHPDSVTESVSEISSPRLNVEVNQSSQDETNTVKDHIKHLAKAIESTTNTETANKTDTETATPNVSIEDMLPSSAKESPQSPAVTQASTAIDNKSSTLLLNLASPSMRRFGDVRADNEPVIASITEKRTLPTEEEQLEERSHHDQEKVTETKQEQHPSPKVDQDDAQFSIFSGIKGHKSKPAFTLSASESAERQLEPRQPDDDIAVWDSKSSSQLAHSRTSGHPNVGASFSAPRSSVPSLAHGEANRPPDRSAFHLKEAILPPPQIGLPITEANQELPPAIVNLLSTPLFSEWADVNGELNPNLVDCLSCFDPNKNYFSFQFNPPQSLEEHQQIEQRMMKEISGTCKELQSIATRECTARAHSICQNAGYVSQEVERRSQSRMNEWVTREEAINEEERYLEKAEQKLGQLVTQEMLIRR